MRKLLIVGIGVVSLALVASVGFLVSLLPKNDIQQSVVAGQSNPESQDPVVQPDEEKPVEITPNQSETPPATTESDGEKKITSPYLGMSVGDLQELLGQAEVIRAVEAAYVYEYPEHTFVVDEQQETVIGYWLFPEQSNQPTELAIDWQKGFAQESTTIDWQGPYPNSGRGSAYVLYGYTTINGVNYVLEFGADDELGLSNQLVAIYQA